MDELAEYINQGRAPTPSRAANRKVQTLQDEGYVVNAIGLTHPQTGQRVLVGYDGKVNWMQEK